jgi:hypothetical protein
MHRGNSSQKLVFFVGGPMSGATMVVSNDVRKYRVAEQETLEALNNLKDDVKQVSFSSHLYQETKEMTNPYYKGCYIFEWMGKN